MPIGIRYFLLEAYDLLGRHLYDREWIGNEIYKTPLPDPEEVKAQRNEMQRKIDDLKKEADLLEAKKKRMLPDEEMAEVVKKLRSLYGQRGKISQELSSNTYDPDERYQADYDAYQRRQVTINTLTDALKNRKVSAQADDQMIIPWHDWDDEDGFKCYWDQSLGIFPKHRMGKRRAAIFIKIDEFDEWCKTIPPISIEEGNPLHAELKAEGILREWCKSPKTKTKEGYKKELMRLAPGLSRNGFLRIWAKTVPRSWSKTGPLDRS